MPIKRECLDAGHEICAKQADSTCHEHIIKVQWEGEEREFELLGAFRGCGTHVIYQDGRIVINTLGSDWGDTKIHLRLMGPHYSCSGLEFEETGETRLAKNEWILVLDGRSGATGITVAFVQGESAHKYPILKPIKETL